MNRIWREIQIRIRADQLNGMNDHAMIAKAANENSFIITMEAHEASICAQSCVAHVSLIAMHLITSQPTQFSLCDSLSFALSSKE